MQIIPAVEAEKYMQPWRPEDLTTDDRKAAHAYLTELRTRIATQPLPYQYGVEERALTSLRELFAEARSTIKAYPQCKIFAQTTTDMLNVVLRPVTAKWHRALNEGRMKSRDGCNSFRGDLDLLRAKMLDYASTLHVMAYGEPLPVGSAPDVMSADDLTACLEPLRYGLQPDTLTPKAIAEAMNKAEMEAISARRNRFELNATPINAVGLGLSGGGIRSATFCLGVVQVLASRGLLKDVDYLSTVSGGGYTGSFLSSLLSPATPHSQVANPHGPDTEPVRHLRQNAKYLMASNMKKRWSMVIASLAGMILNWTAPAAIIGFLALLFVSVARLIDMPWPMLVGFGFAGIALGLLFYGGETRLRKQGSGGGVLSVATGFTLLILVLWAMSLAYEAPNMIPAYVLGGLAAAAAAVPTLIRFLPVLAKPWVRRLVLKIALGLSALLVPLAGIALGMWFYHLGMIEAGDTSAFWTAYLRWPGWGILLLMSSFLALVALFLLNINLTGPHRLYRDQLARAFIRNDPKKTEPLHLFELNPDNYAPYHLINAAVNLPSSTSPAMRERKSDFFLFSKAYCGAPSIGYFKTTDWKAQGKNIDLATAMAVSGAAASSYMGLASYPTLSALLTLLNVRLGYWMKRPQVTRGSQTPGFACLLREMTGVQMDESQAWLNLSDGGHIENMGIYELLRRRCKFIISIDGEADPSSNFHGHLTLVRHAQIDFGIRIDPNLSDLRPELTSQFSKSHAMLARVRYPGEGVGLILYVKLSVTGDEIETIRRYRALNPDFPHQTTLDQFFDEEQFEAYRQLGVHVAEGLFARALIGAGDAPGSVGDWFSRLARNLLEPLQQPVDKTHPQPTGA